MAPPEQRRAVAQLGLAALFWSTGGLLIKHVDWPPLAVSGGRGFFAAVFLLLTHRGLRFSFSRLQLIGALGYAACTIAFCVATKLTTAANAILLQYTAPVWIALFAAWFLGERTTRQDWIAVVLVVGGMGLFLADGLAVGNVLGDAIGVFSGVAFAGMTIALRAQKHGSPVESIILGNLIAFVVGVPWMIDTPLPSATGWAALVALGVVQLGCSYWLYARAIKHVTALQAVLIPVIEPLLNPLWVLLIVGERPTRLALIGGAIVLAAVTWRAIAALRPPRMPGVVQ
jgi:drug/metabolite transporter (DMT)-like permease